MEHHVFYGHPHLKETAALNTMFLLSFYLTEDKLLRSLMGYSL